MVTHPQLHAPPPIAPSGGARRPGSWTGTAPAATGSSSSRASPTCTSGCAPVPLGSLKMWGFVIGDHIAGRVALPHRLSTIEPFFAALFALFSSFFPRRGLHVVRIFPVPVLSNPLPTPFPTGGGGVQEPPLRCLRLHLGPQPGGPWDGSRWLPPPLLVRRVKGLFFITAESQYYRLYYRHPLKFKPRMFIRVIRPPKPCE